MTPEGTPPEGTDEAIIEQPAAVDEGAGSQSVEQAFSPIKPAPDPEEQSEQEEPRLLAGRFQSPEELEAAYAEQTRHVHEDLLPKAKRADRYENFLTALDEYPEFRDHVTSFSPGGSPDESYEETGEMTPDMVKQMVAQTVGQVLQQRDQETQINRQLASLAEANGLSPDQLDDFVKGLEQKPLTVEEMYRARYGPAPREAEARGARRTVDQIRRNQSLSPGLGAVPGQRDETLEAPEEFARDLINRVLVAGKRRPSA